MPFGAAFEGALRGSDVFVGGDVFFVVSLALVDGVVVFVVPVVVVVLMVVRMVVLLVVPVVVVCGVLAEAVVCEVAVPLVLLYLDASDFVFAVLFGQSQVDLDVPHQAA